MRVRRQYWRARAFRRQRELRVVADRTAAIRAPDVLVFSTIRNERIRLPYFLKYYREMGVRHFLMVDNGSDDGSREYLQTQGDVSLWTTSASYKRSRFGVDWLNWLQSSYGHNTITVLRDGFEWQGRPYKSSSAIARAITGTRWNGYRFFGLRERKRGND
jgi:hypothetical protein